MNTRVAAFSLVGLVALLAIVIAVPHALPKQEQAAAVGLPPGVSDTITITDKSGAGEQNYPLQFGRPFVQGEITQYPQVLINGSPVTTQADVKNRYPDGSVKFAIISVMIPSIPANGSLTLSFTNQSTGNNTPLSPATVLNDTGYNFDAQMKLTNNGTTLTADARQMLQNGSFTYWTQGPIATTFLLADDSTNRQYDLGFDSYKSFRPRFYVTVWPATHQVQVRYVGEDSNTTTLEPISYDLALTIGSTNPQSVFSEAAVNHPFLTRWTKTAWINGTPEQQVNIDNNLQYLETTNYFPAFDTSMTIPESVLSSEWNSWQSSKHTQINDTGFWTSYMPTTGGRGDIGPVPDWTAKWLYTGDWRARTIALGLADLAGAWPNYARETDTTKKIDKAQSVSGLGLPISAYAYPHLWFPDNNGSYGQLALQSSDTACINYQYPCWVVDNAHQPDPFYTQYVLTGDYYYLEGAQMWAAMDSVSENRNYQGWTQGIRDQERGNAWDLRNRANAAFITPDDETTLKNYFGQLTTDALAFFDGEFGITSDGYQGTTEWQWANANFPQLPNPLHWGGCFGDGCDNAPWQQYYWSVVLGMLHERGFNDGGLLMYLGNFITQQITAAGYNPYNLGDYHVVAQDRNGTWYPAWADFQTANVSLGNAFATGDFTVTSPGAYYPILATAASSFITNDDSGTAWNWLNANVKQAALTNNGTVPSWYAGYYNGTDEAGWNIVPRGQVQNNLPTASLNADPGAIDPGASSTLSWASTNATSCTGAGFDTGGAPSGTASVTPATTTTYSVTCTGSTGQASAQTTVTVNQQQQQPTATLTANPTQITAGQSSTLMWSSTNADSCTGSGFDTGSKTSGSVTVSPTQTTTYSVTCTGAGGQAQAQTAVTVNPVGGPTASLSASPSQVSPGHSSNLKWSSTNATSCTGTGFDTGGKTIGSVKVTPSQTTTYTVTCTGIGGTAQAQATVTVKGDTGGNCVPAGIISGDTLTGTAGNDCLTEVDGIHVVNGNGGIDTLTLTIPAGGYQSWYYLMQKADGSYFIKDQHASGYYLAVKGISTLISPDGQSMKLSLTPSERAQETIDIPNTVHSVSGTHPYNIAYLDWGPASNADKTWFKIVKKTDGSYSVQDIHATGYTVQLVNIQEIIFPNFSDLVLSDLSVHTGIQRFFADASGFWQELGAGFGRALISAIGGLFH